MIDVSVIIVSYNTAELTCAAIASVYEQTKQVNFEILVIDNNSTDDSADMIEKSFPSVRLIRLYSNKGFAAANNIAAEEAEGRYILLLNPDTLVLDGAIDKLVNFADKNTEYGIYGGSTFFGDMSRNPTAGWNMATVWSLFSTASGLSSIFRKSRFFNPESLSWWDWKRPRRVDIVTGCFLLIHRDLWNRLEGFDTRFYMYGEDADLCLRSAAINRFCIIVPDAKIIHFGGASEVVKEDKMIRLLTAKVQLFRKHWKGIKRKYAILMLEMWTFSRMTVLFFISMVKKNNSPSFHSWKKVWYRRSEWETV
ncbi:hypothetical protein B4O97_15955 [Marispirochaeta aestuarii]|uniref:Glycosyltransferase 2-like domain-containing protein n=1 Tax=Marispirochaeta aestuarii TaxID=1963862 RepID=A0A1Y1RUE8_9SPIO|nr:glycosyltransferase family 2 protein [Marispirochaeta aestuarii]ORC32652.1 hypothetical protein B4O97_15955 [Marispirochaeta aestuarii]